MCIRDRCVDTLDGAPGVYSARYCGHHGDDEANNDKLLAAMQAVPAGQRGAKFVSAVCFILPDGRHLTCICLLYTSRSWLPGATKPYGLARCARWVW